MIYLYRGMPALDLLSGDVILDPKHNAFGEYRDLFLRYAEALQALVDGGFEFTVHDTYDNPLSNIVRWTLRDLQSPSIDFTESYAQNYCGSQVKHNFRIIADAIGSHGAAFDALTAEIKQVLAIDGENPHKPVVLKDPRSDAFADTDHGCVKLVQPLKCSDIEEIIYL